MWTTTETRMNMSSAPPEIATFKRRHVAIIPFLLSFANLIVIWCQKRMYYYHPKNINVTIPNFLFCAKSVCVVGTIHHQCGYSVGGSLYLYCHLIIGTAIPLSWHGLG